MTNDIGNVWCDSFGVVAESTVRTADNAISLTGCRATVSGGEVNSDSTVPSKPITATSCGTRRPDDWRARSTPTACRSELVKIALGGLRAASRCIAAGTHPPG